MFIYYLFMKEEGFVGAVWRHLKLEGNFGVKASSFRMWVFVGYPKNGSTSSFVI